MPRIKLRFIILIIGLAFMGFGISLFLTSGLGSDPMTVLMQGLSLTTQLSIGRMSQVFMAVILISVYVLGYKGLGIGTVLCVIFLGFFIDFFINMDFPKFNIFFLDFSLLLLGTLSLGFGTGLYVSCRMGVGAVEALMLFLHLRTRIRIKWVRIFIDITAVSLGGLLGGTIGLGTIIGAFATGPIAEATILKMRKINVFGDFFPEEKGEQVAK